MVFFDIIDGFMKWVLFVFKISLKFLWVFFFAENDGFEEGICRDNPEHGEGGGGEDNGIREKITSVFARSYFHQRGSASSFAPAKTNYGC